MSKYFRKIMFFMGMLLLVFSCGSEKKEETVSTNSEKKELTISIAASTKNAVDDIIKIYTEKNPNIEIKVNSGASGALEQQIVGGAPVDLFLSASKKNMDNLDEKGFLLEGTRKDLLKNELVLIGSAEMKGKISTIEELKDMNVKMALGEIGTTPAGKYAKQSFEKLGIWADIEPKIIYQKDVTTVLNIVDSGELEVGAVYSSDALTLKNGFVIASFDDTTHDPILYPVAVIKDTKEKDEAIKFLEFLESPESKEIFAKYGFKL